MTRVLLLQAGRRGDVCQAVRWREVADLIAGATATAHGARQQTVTHLYLKSALSMCQTRTRPRSNLHGLRESSGDGHVADLLPGLSGRVAQLVGCRRRRLDVPRLRPIGRSPNVSRTLRPRSLGFVGASAGPGRFAAWPRNPNQIAAKLVFIGCINAKNEAQAIDSASGVGLRH
jgi:hypothetical protein